MKIFQKGVSFVIFWLVTSWSHQIMGYIIYVANETHDFRQINQNSDFKESKTWAALEAKETLTSFLQDREGPVYPPWLLH